MLISQIPYVSPGEGKGGRVSLIGAYTQEKKSCIYSCLKGLNVWRKKLNKGKIGTFAFLVTWLVPIYGHLTAAQLSTIYSLCAQRTYK